MWEILRETQITLNELTKTINRIEAHMGGSFQVIAETLQRIEHGEEEEAPDG